MRFPVIRDAFERIYSTFGVALLAILSSDLINLQDVLKLDNWKGWGLAALTASFTALKTMIAAQVAKRRGQATSASFDPAVQLKPKSEVVTE